MKTFRTPKKRGLIASIKLLADRTDEWRIDNVFRKLGDILRGM